MTNIDDQVAQRLTDARLADDLNKIASDVRRFPPEEREARLREAARRLAQPNVQVLITLPNGRQVFLRTSDPSPVIMFRQGVADTWSPSFQHASRPHSENTFYVGEW